MFYRSFLSFICDCDTRFMKIALTALAVIFPLFACLSREICTALILELEPTLGQIQLKKIQLQLF